MIDESRRTHGGTKVCLRRIGRSKLPWHVSLEETPTDPSTDGVVARFRSSGDAWMFYLDLFARIDTYEANYENERERATT